MNISAPICRHAAERPHATAVIRRSVAISYRDLDRTVDVVARRVQALGLTAGQTAAVAVASPYLFLVLTLALARCGIAIAPTSLPAAAIDVCFAPEHAPSRGYRRVVPVDPDWAATPPPGALVTPVTAHPDDEATCIVFASSGTTGYPKHVAVSHALLARRIEAKAHLAPLPPDVRQVCPLGLAGGYGFRDQLRVLWSGGTVVLSRNADEVVAAIARHAANYLVASPAMLDRIVAALPPGARPFPSLTTIEVGGSLMPARLYESARQRLCPDIRSSYGATETGSVAAGPMAALVGRSRAVGYVVPGVEVQAVDADDRPLPPGVEGILRIRSDLCVDHYLDDDDATTLAFRDGWFYPGDLGVVTADRVLCIEGRVSEVINSGGSKVSPQAIEEILLSFDRIRDAAVFGVPDDAGLTQIWAAIVPNGQVDVPVLEAMFRRRLPGGMPKVLLQLERLPRNEGGKIARDELVRLAAEATRGRL